jgi:phosphoribosylanthranilate isomerase
MAPQRRPKLFWRVEPGRAKSWHGLSPGTWQAMTWVKICGITNLEDALVAIDAGAEALGFVFHDQSSRYVRPQVAREIVSKLPEEIEKVGVFVDLPEDRAVNIFNQVKLTAIQWHIFGVAGLPGQTRSDSYWRAPKVYPCLPAASFISESERWKEVRSSLDELFGDSPSESSNQATGFGRTFFLDSGTREQPGGTGQQFDWRLAAPMVAEVKKNARVVVAGGLSANNVGEAITILEPYGVDVSSGVELRPGKKDPERVRAFLGAVRQAEKALSL